MLKELKQRALVVCKEKVEERLQEIFKGIAQAQEAIESDTKSSAGDKYETSREMIQQDLNRYHEQLDQGKRDLNVLQQMELTTKEQVELGALVQTDTVLYFIAVSLGRVEVDGKLVMVISASSPIGKLLIGNQVDDAIQFNGNKQRILAIA